MSGSQRLAAGRRFVGEPNPVRFRRLGLGLVGLAALAALAAGLAPSEAARPSAPVEVAQLGSTVPPPPTAAPKRGKRSGSTGGPSPSPTPTDSPVPAQFATLDGVWEVEVQPMGSSRTQYSHLSIVQNGNTVGGYWQHDPHLTRSAFTGTFDGRLFQIVIDLGNGKSATMSGYAENFSDFVGLLRTSDGSQTAFTAQHRRKERAQ
jgi:hypothetical protein